MANNHSGKKNLEISNMKAVLSTLWIFVTVNYLYCDVMSLMDPTLLKQFLKGFASGFQITPGFLTGAAILMEIPMAMILLSRVLKDRANRRANISAGVMMTAVQIASLFAGPLTLYYGFFSIVEIACTSVIVRFAWTWRNTEGNKIQ